MNETPLTRYDSVETLLDSDHVPVSGAVALRVGQNAPRGSMGGATMPFLPQAEILAPFSQSPLMRFLVTQGVLRAFPKEKLAPILELLDVTDIPCQVGDRVQFSASPLYVDARVCREYR